MSDDIKVVDDVETGSAPETPDFESQAKEMGWNPEYDGPNKIGAKEFVERKPLYDDLKKLRKKTRELEQAVMTQKQMYEQGLKTERDRVMRELTAKRTQAIQEGNVEQVTQIDTEIRQVSAKPVTAPSVPKEYIDFVDRNSWYDADEDAKTWADAYGFKLKQSNPNITPSELFSSIEQKARSLFPQHFKNPKRDAPPAVESGTPSGNTAPKEVKIPRDHKVLCESMWKKGAWGNVPFKKALEIYTKDYTDKFGDFE